MIYALGIKTLQASGSYYVAPGAIVVGDVCFGDKVSVWFNAVVRADNDAIKIGAGSNVQDCAALHVDQNHPINVGERVSVGHHAMLHGCTIGDGSLIGINAVVLNDAVVGKNCLIGANALVTESMIVPDGSLVLGSPGKVVRVLSDSEMAMIAAGTQSYMDKMEFYASELQSIAE